MKKSILLFLILFICSLSFLKAQKKSSHSYDLIFNSQGELTSAPPIRIGVNDQIRVTVQNDLNRNKQAAIDLFLSYKRGLNWMLKMGDAAEISNSLPFQKGLGFYCQRLEELMESQVLQDAGIQTSGTSVLIQQLKSNFSYNLMDLKGNPFPEYETIINQAQQWVFEYSYEDEFHRPFNLSQPIVSRQILCAGLENSLDIATCNSSEQTHPLYLKFDLKRTILTTKAFQQFYEILHRDFSTIMPNANTIQNPITKESLSSDEIKALDKLYDKKKKIYEDNLAKEKEQLASFEQQLLLKKDSLETSNLDWEINNLKYKIQDSQVRVNQMKEDLKRVEVEKEELEVEKGRLALVDIEKEIQKIKNKNIHIAQDVNSEKEAGVITQLLLAAWPTIYLDYQKIKSVNQIEEIDLITSMVVDEWLYQGQLLLSTSQDPKLSDYSSHRYHKTYLKNSVNYMRHHDALDNYVPMHVKNQKQINEVQRMHVLVHNERNPDKITVTVNNTEIQDDQTPFAEATTESATGNTSVKTTGFDIQQILNQLAQPVIFRKDTLPTYATKVIPHEGLYFGGKAPIKVNYNLKTRSNAVSEVYQFRINKLYRFRFKFGMVYSFLEKKKFNLSEDQKAVNSIENEDLGLDFMYGLQFFFKRVDIQNPHLGLRPFGFFGLGTKSIVIDNYYFGSGIEPINGLSIMGGAHLGPETVLKTSNNIFYESTKFKVAPFVSLAMDLNIFTRIFKLPSLQDLRPFRRKGTASNIIDPKE